MEQITVIARFNINAGKENEFKQWAHDLIAIVQAKDPGTFQYDWFFNADHTECVVHETYEDSNAAMAHMVNTGDLLGKGADLGTLTLELYGSPSAELAGALAPFNAPTYAFHKGL